MTTLLQQLINGAAIGSQYALWAVGYGLVYQILGLYHFAHGDTLLLAMFVGFTLLVTLGLPLPVAIPLMLAVGALVAMIIERAVYAPLVRRLEFSSAFTAALGAAYVLRNITTLGWGVFPVVFPHSLPTNSMQIGGLYLAVTPLVMLGTAIAVVGVFTTFLRFTRYGQAILALAQDRTTASLMGIPAATMVTLVYGLSGIVGVAGAFLYVSNFGVLHTTDGFFITLKAFVAAMIGGIGRIEGAVLGGLMLGILEALLIQYVSASYSDALVYGCLVLLLIWRPNGILGRKELVKL
jgi:branched-chain amino acid transport system permease protein